MQPQTDQILITGARGWLGKRLTRVIAERSLDLDVLRGLPRTLRLRCMVLPSEDPAELRAMGAEVMQGDVRNPADCEKFFEGARGAVLMHPAGIIHPQKVKDLYDVTLNGTKNLLGSAVAAGVRRAVIVSSNSPIGLNPHRGHLF